MKFILEPVSNLVFHCVGGPKLRKWYGAPDPYAEDRSILEEADRSSGNLLELIINYYYFLTLVAKPFASL